MPEGIEVEMYRRAAERVVGRTISVVLAPDTLMCRGATSPEQLVDALTGARILAARRLGKLLMIDTTSVTLGMRFGMTGRLIVDGVAAIEELEYGAKRDDEAWNRFGLRFLEGGELWLNDSRRLGGVELDPDVAALGPDAFIVTLPQLAVALAGSLVSVKARLLDQHRIAGIGNLLADETLWRAGIDPARRSADISVAEIKALHRELRRVLTELTRRGGSHRGDLQSQRHPHGVCPHDGAPLRRRTISGRTSFSCPLHQR